MYAYLNGIVKNIDNEKIILEVSNIGYNIFMPQDDLCALTLEESKKIYTHFVHREDDMKLYGFLTNSKLEFFKKLTSVSGVGSKVGLNIISNISETDMCTAIVSENVNVLKKVPGIGPKMAAKIIFELKDKINLDEIITDNKIENKTKKDLENEDVKEAILALGVLGYSFKELNKIIKEEDFEGLKVEEIIKKCLKLLQK